MSVLEQADLLRVKANSVLDPRKRPALGQFFTASPICLYMASLFTDISGEVRLLDPGCGPGSLTAAFLDEALRRRRTQSIDIETFDIEAAISPYISETLRLCADEASKRGIKIASQFNLEDFILTTANNFGLFSTGGDCTHVIMNPPYKKIVTDSLHRQALRSSGIETVNLYSGFVALAIQKLLPGGELVAIIPRSFCNGPYYQPFREYMLRETFIQHIHIFDSRSDAFSDDKVLQENVIIHLIKGSRQKEVIISASPGADFHFDKETESITATDKTIRYAPIESIVIPGDNRKLIHIAANGRDQSIVARLACFNTPLCDLGLQVSTGPVVDFRLKEDLRRDIESGAVPLIYPAHLPIHLTGGLQWPKHTKKPNAIRVSKTSRSGLWKNAGSFLLVKRFSSKEEKKRMVAVCYDGSLPGDLIGFDNKLNVFHANKKGVERAIVVGLSVYINSTLLDGYYRLFSGHTQVNATDLKAINYPSAESLRRMAREAESVNLTQEKIDDIVNREITKMSGDPSDPLLSQTKLDQALEIIAALGMPRAQQNERSALTLLALINLRPSGAWQAVERPLLGVTPLMAWCRDVYGKEYAPNTRETFRRQTLHQFIAGGLCLYNPDKPNRPVNSPKACYQVTEELCDLLASYETDRWETSLRNWLSNRETLVARYAMQRGMAMIPLKIDDSTEIALSPGIHSQLIRDIITEFGPRFAPSAEVIYIGDTGAKEDFFKKEKLAELGVTINRKGKLPDVVLYLASKNWLLLIESVTSHGPMDGKRYGELSGLFDNAKPGLVYVTAFPNRKAMSKYLADISWETEVWIADAPDHLIHFNGDKFLGPY